VTLLTGLLPLAEPLRLVRAVLLFEELLRLRPLLEPRDALDRDPLALARDADDFRLVPLAVRLLLVFAALAVRLLLVFAALAVRLPLRFDVLAGRLLPLDELFRLRDCPLLCAMVAFLLLSV
jgi:hypothetical protein